MTEKQRINYNLMLKALKDIAESDSVERLRRNAYKEWGTDFIDALEMSYENAQQHAKDAARGIKFIPSTKVKEL